MRFRPVVDLKGERFRDAYPELARLITRRPQKSRPWRDFWKVWIPAFTLVMVALGLLDTTPFSPLGVVVLGGGALVTVLIGKAFRRLGVISDYRHDKHRHRST